MGLTEVGNDSVGPSHVDGDDPNGESKSPNTSKQIKVAEWSGDNGFELRNVWQSKDLEVTPVATMLANFDMSDSGSELEEENEELLFLFNPVDVDDDDDEDEDGDDAANAI